jgi:hypothetical protein
MRELLKFSRVVVPFFWSWRQPSGKCRHDFDLRSCWETSGRGAGSQGLSSLLPSDALGQVVDESRSGFALG